MRFDLTLSDLIQSENKLKIIKFLLTHEAAMSEREIASILQISHMGINRALRELADLNFVDYTVVGKAHLWKVNRKSYIYKTLGQFIKATKNLIDPFSELKELILKTLPLKLIDRIIIFGSIAGRSSKPDSDIDVFILLKNADGLKAAEHSIEKLSAQCLDTFGNRLSPYVLTNEQYRQKKNLNLISEINKGIQIYPNGKASHDSKI